MTQAKPPQARFEIYQFECLSDNYGYLIFDPETHECAAIDTPDADAINAALSNRNWALTHIFNTHWHPDHTGGNLALKQKWRCDIIGPRAEGDKIPGADRLVGTGDNVMLGGAVAAVIDTPGHTSGHIVYHFAEDGIAFVGDTLFALGCGRLFEGTPDQMWSSLKRLRALPDETLVYCAHEYTQANARFALTAEPANEALMKRAVDIDAARAKGVWTVPTTIGLEKETNPFLRADTLALQEALNMTGHDPVAVFAEVRARKDKF